MSLTIKATGSGITKIDVLRSLALGLRQLSIEGETGDTYVLNTTQTKDGICIECVDGMQIELELKTLK